VANRQLNKDELAQAALLLAEVRQRLSDLSAGDKELLFALRRKLFKELMYDERSKPMARRRLKQEKLREQQGLCPICGKTLPKTYAVLDRANAVDGYTAANTRLIHAECDAQHQASKGYT
jgi:DNA repair exonuclease SbcCD ATPase subunit